ncbi:MAG: hypothetical protein WA981_03855 [Glaciecola sp.]
MIKVIGIDPDMRNPGIVKCADGVFDFIEKTKYSTSMIIEDVPLWVSYGYIFAIEDVNAVKTIYAKNRRGNQAVQSRIAQNVGMVRAAGTILTDYIEHHGGQVILVPPGIGKQTKKDAKLFAELTGYTGRTNEDTRDAYWIAKYAYNKLKNGDIK